MRSRRSDRAASLSALCLGLALAVAMSPGIARADEETREVVDARAEFVQGTALAKRTQWGEALVAFERSSKLRPHAITTYNIGICHRAMGSYTLARETLLRALAENEKAGGAELADALTSDAKGVVVELDGLLATADVQLSPANAAVAVDGRPLAPSSGDANLLVAGVRAPGPGEAPPSGTFRVQLNPGAHVFTVSRPGFADAFVNRTAAPGSRFTLKLELDRLPATLHVASDVDGAVVRVDDVDVGVAPVDVQRPAGVHRVVVRKQGFEPYESQFSVSPGQELDLRAKLARETTAITKKWWFWTAAGTLLVGVAAGTYALTRGETTTQEPLDGGGLGWTVKLH